MLSKYIENYKKAMEEGNKKEMERIEKDLAKLGMDKMTLMLLIQEV